jgi:RNA polymerase sigma factor (sigma-70 family)
LTFDENWRCLKENMAEYSDSPDFDVVDEFEVDDPNEHPPLDEAAQAPPGLPRRHSGADEAQFQAWLARIVRQDEAALNDLYRACIGRVYGLALRIVRIPALAEEVAEDCFWQVWRQAPRFEAARGTALGWVLTIARSRALDTLRSQRQMMDNTVSVESLNEGELVQCETDAIGASAGADALLQAVQTNQHLHQALAQIDAVPRQLVALAFFKGLSHEEISSHTGLPLGTVKTHIRRAMAALRTALSMKPTSCLSFDLL